MTTDYKKVAETLCSYTRCLDKGDECLIDAAIALCLLAAKLPPGEAERVLEAATKLPGDIQASNVLAQVAKHETFTVLRVTE